MYSLVLEEVLNDGGSEYRFSASGNAMQPKGRLGGQEPIFVFGALNEPISRMFVSQLGSLVLIDPWVWSVEPCNEASLFLVCQYQE